MEGWLYIETFFGDLIFILTVLNKNEIFSLTGERDCICYAGFAGEDCADINECALSDDVCPEDSFCLNIAGSFTCVCDPGFTGDQSGCQGRSL